MAGRVSANETASAPVRVASRQVWKVGAVAALGAAAVNAVILVVAKIAGVEFFVPDMQGRIVEIGIGQVALMSILPLMLGTASAWIASRLSVSLRWVQGTAALLTLVSFVSPLALDSPVSTKLVLSAMHVVAGVAFVAGVERAHQAR